MKTNIILTLCLCSLLCSCKDKSVALGTVEYYPSFLWVDENISSVSKTMDCDFSIDAEQKKSFAEFQFVDNNGNAISTDIMQVKVDGVVAEQNRFRVNSGTKSVNLEFSFTSDAPSGKHQGYLQLIDHDLDRIDSKELLPNENVDVLQWTLHFEKAMNPLAFTLLIVGIILMACLILWFAILKPIFFPLIKVSRVEMNGENCSYYLTKKINRCRKLVFTSKRTKQSVLNKIFLGEVKYVVDDVWTDNWELYPGKKKTVKAMFHGKYTISPMEPYLSQMNEYTISKLDNTRIKILIN